MFYQNLTKEKLRGSVRVIKERILLLPGAAARKVKGDLR
jgi:hypothetical protein